MPRPPNPKAKTSQLIFKAPLGGEEKLNAFKMLHARNGLSMSDTLWESVEDFLRMHHWPPGNSQTVLDDVNNPLQLPKWKTCSYSNKKYSKGEIYCRQMGSWLSVERCELCKDYREEKL